MDLARHLRSWSASELGRLLELRPDLLPATDRGIDAVARKAGTTTSLGRALVAADVGMLVVAEALVAVEPATVDELDELLGTGDPLAVVDAVERLRHRGLVLVEGGVVRAVGALPDLLHRPLGLGPSFAELADHLPSGALERLASDTRAEGGRRSPTIRAVARRLRDPAVIHDLLADAPAGVVDLLDELTARRSPAVPLDPGHSYRSLDLDDPLGWLLHRGFVVAVSDRGAELVREVAVAAHPSGLAPGAALRPIGVDAGPGIDPALTAGRAADRANRTLDGAEGLLRSAARGEISVRRAGGVGPRELKRLARSAGLDETEVVRLLELLLAARLITVDRSTVRASELADRWWRLSRPRRYLALVRAWVGADHFLSRGLEPDADEGGGVAALGASEPVAATAAARATTLDTLAEVPSGQSWEADQVAAAIVWQAPNLWGPGQPPPEQLVGWTIAEAALLGLVADEAPTPLLRALRSGDEGDLGVAAAAAVTDDQTTIVLQGDLTALTLGPLAPAVADPLAQMTDREPGGDGHATAFRFSEASVRRAYDAGWTAETITAFLGEHALAGIPQPLDYLLADVARRYGTVTVLAAASVVVTDDDVGAVEIASHRRAGALGLRLIAPTVLLSPLDPVTVTEGLRAAGFLPVLRGETVEVGRADGTSWPGDDDRPIGDLPADWTGPPLPLTPFPDEVADAVSALLDEGTDDRTTADAADGTVAADLARAWGRPARLVVTAASGPPELSGTIVGVGPVVSVLTPAGVVELPAASVRSVERLDEP
ncbi:MAG: helicase-associated domain-containing protein [Actinomycetota bacterium]